MQYIKNPGCVHREHSGFKGRDSLPIVRRECVCMVFPFHTGWKGTKDGEPESVRQPVTFRFPVFSWAAPYAIPAAVAPAIVLPTCGDHPSSRSRAHRPHIFRRFAINKAALSAHTVPPFYERTDNSPGLDQIFIHAAHFIFPEPHPLARIFVGIYFYIVAAGRPQQHIRQRCGRPRRASPANRSVHIPLSSTPRRPSAVRPISSGFGRAAHASQYVRSTSPARCPAIRCNVPCSGFAVRRKLSSTPPE